MESASANSSDTTASSPLERRRRILECGVGDCSSQYQIQEAEHYCLRHEKMDLLKKLKDDDENNNGSDEKDHDGHATKTKNSDAYYGPLPIILHHHPYQYHQSNITPADMAAEVQRRPDLPQQRLETTTTISGTWRTLDENETTLVEVRQQESSSIAASTAAFVQQEAEEEPQQRQQQEDDCCRPEEEEAAALPATSDNIHENSTFESCFSEEETTSPPPLVVFGSGGGVQKDNAVEKQQQQVELCCETLAMSSTTSTKNNTPVQQQQNMNGNISNIAVSIFRRSLTAELEQENMEPQQRLLAVPSCLEKCGNSSGSHQQRRNNKDINSSKSGNHGDRSGNSMCCYTRSDSDDEGVDSSSNGGAVNQQQRSRVVACAAAGATAVEENIRMQVYQICLYSIVGMTIRVYSERLFGLDCTTGTAAVQDVFTPFFSQICVTTNGFTNQTGGALFIDLPANMLGCFIIGLISNTSRPEHPIPWFDANHTLQKNASYLLGLRVGLCGCLTTCTFVNKMSLMLSLYRFSFMLLSHTRLFIF
jgi:fluoride ion exporter CrcB/FEX